LRVFLFLAVLDLDAQTFINILVGICAGLGGWVLNSVRQSVSRLQDQDQALADKVQRIEVLVAGQYVKRDDMDKLTSAIFAKLDRIESKLDGKQDK